MFWPTRWQRATTKPERGVQIDWSHPLARGLVGCWLFNEAAGNINHSLVNPQHKATVVAAGVGWGAGRVGPARDFTSGTASLEVPASPLLRLSGSGSSVAFVRPTLGGVNAQVAEHNANSGWRYRRTTSGTLELIYRDTGGALRTFTTSTPVPLGEWSQVGFSADASGARLYINGIRRASFPVAFGGSATAAPTYLGTSAFSEGWRGQISEIYVWSRALTDSEIAWLYVDPYAFFATPLARMSVLGEPQWSASATLGLSVSGSLTTSIHLEASATLSVTPSGALTTGIPLSAALAAELSMAGTLKTAVVGGTLPACGHPILVAPLGAVGAEAEQGSWIERE